MLSSLMSVPIYGLSSNVKGLLFLYTSYLFFVIVVCLQQSFNYVISHDGFILHFPDLGHAAHTHKSLVPSFEKYVSRSSADFKAVLLMLSLLDCLHFLLLCVLILYQQNDLQIIPSILSIDCSCLVDAFFSILSITILLIYTYLLASALGSHLGNPYGNKRHKDLPCFLLVILQFSSLTFKSLINFELSF